MGRKKARTQRTLIRGTAKRLAEKYAKPRPMGRVPDGLSALKIRGFRMRPVAKLRKILVVYFSIVF